mgnify:CR=1 FL=1
MEARARQHQSLCCRRLPRRAGNNVLRHIEHRHSDVKGVRHKVDCHKRLEHPTFEDYFYHKRLLLENSRVVIVNSGMDHFAFIAEEVADKEHDFYGKNSDNAVKHGSGFSFKASGKLAGDYDIQLIGDFNQDNAMAAGLACLRLGASLQDIKEGIAQTSVPGRMEVLTQTNGAKTFVDYAHNGDSLDKLLQVDNYPSRWPY